MTEQCKFCSVEQIHLPWPICREKNECAGSVVKTGLGMAPLRVEGMRTVMDENSLLAKYAATVAAAGGKPYSYGYVLANNQFLQWVDNLIETAHVTAIWNERKRVRRLKRKKFPTKRGK